MGHFASVVVDEIKRTARHPKRVINLLKPKRWAYVSFRLRIGDRWKNSERGKAFTSREYTSYQDYIDHQSSKLSQIDLGEYDRRYRETLRERLGDDGFVKPGMNALCLGARQGTEVKSFIDLGLFAIGIDLEPGKGNRYVVVGDFHDLQYAAASVDVIFSNAIDHAFDFGKLLDQIVRVIRPGGYVIFELPHGTEEGKSPGFWASFWWEKTADIAKAFEARGFTLRKHEGFTYPWKGDHVVLQRT